MAVFKNKRIDPQHHKKTEQKPQKQSERSFSFWAYAPAIFAVVLGILLSIAAFAMVRNWDMHRIRANFDRDTSDRVSQLKREIESNLLLVESLRSFFAGSVQVEREEFRVFAEPLLVPPATALALGWAPRIPDSRRKYFEQQRRDEGFTEFKITNFDAQEKLIDTPDQDEYFPLDFVEPYASNSFMHGLDISSIPNCSQAMLTACQTGKATATAPLDITSHGSNGCKIMVVVPIYKKRTTPQTIQNRQEQLEGFVLGLYRIPDILQYTLSSLVSHGINVSLYDSTSPHEKHPIDLYCSHDTAKPDLTDRVENSSARFDMTYQSNIKLPGRKWLVVCSATNQYLELQIGIQPWGALVMGLLLTSLMATYFITSIDRTTRIERLVHDRTIELKNANEQLNHKILEIKKLNKRQWADEALKHNEAMYRQAIENANGIPYHYRWEDYKYLFIGSGIEKMFGITPEELSDGRYAEMVEEFTIIHPADDKDFNAFYEAVKRNDHEQAARYRKAFHEKLERGEVERCQIDYRIRNAKGQTKWISDYWVPARDEITHHVTGSIGIMLDITERKKAEQNVIDLNHSLKAKNKELQRLVYAISHDLKSPLVNIQGFSKELNLACEKITALLKESKLQGPMRELQNLLAQDVPEAIRYIHAGTDKMNSLLNAISRLSRFGTSRLSLQNLDMNQMINEISKSMEFQLKEANITIEIDTLPSCTGDSSQINQLFSNLIENAVKYRNPDHKTVISISGHLTQDRVIYSVRDNGPGIDDEHKEKIFELFHRADNLDIEGEGIGLTIARQIVDRHNGKIWVESTLGQGSEFFVTLTGTTTP